MHLTQKQLELMRVIVEANPDGTPTDLDQIIERANYSPSKQSVQFTIRALIGHGLIEKLGQEKRRERQRVIIGATDLGRHFAGPRRALSIISSVEEDAALEEIEDLGSLGSGMVGL